MRLAPTLLILNGEVGDPARVRRLAGKCRAVVCADGGVRHAVRLGLKPRFVVGDMDSLPPFAPGSKKLRKTVYWCDFDENRSDLEKALDFIREIGTGPLWVAGARGGRFDHELINLKVLERQAGRIDITLIGDALDSRLLAPGAYRVAMEKGAGFSLAAVVPSRVTLAGAKFPLKGHALPPGARGLSNIALGPVRLKVTAGLLWLVADRLV